MLGTESWSAIRNAPRGNGGSPTLTTERLPPNRATRERRSTDSARACRAAFPWVRRPCSASRSGPSRSSSFARSSTYEIGAFLSRCGEHIVYDAGRAPPDPSPEKRTTSAPNTIAATPMSRHSFSSLSFVR